MTLKSLDESEPTGSVPGQRRAFAAASARLECAPVHSPAAHCLPPHLPVICTLREAGWRYRLEMPPRLVVTEPVTPAQR